MSAWIRLRNLTLDVPVFLPQESRASGWRSLLAGAALGRARRGLARLLDDLTLDIQEGDRLAILGRNGAGKSTLLRVLNGVYQPTQGSIQVHGSRQALLNIALGFNGDATVRENVLLRGSAMGVSAAFLMSQINGILDFSGLTQKANHLLRTLSSGQRIRLGFAISTCVQHDIMLMDEWVGTGDSEFMAKAKERMQSRVGGSKIVVLASHSVGLLRDVCNKGIVLEKGRLIHAGDITSSLRAYHELMEASRSVVVVENVTDAAAQVYGCVEKIEAYADGILSFSGWFADTQGGVPDSFAVEVDGTRIHAEQVVACKRPDVMRHMGLAHENYGFQARLRVPAAITTSSDSVLQASAGYGGSCGAPLRLGAKALDDWARLLGADAGK